MWNRRSSAKTSLILLFSFCFLILILKGFAFDQTEVAPAVIPHKIENRIELLVYELSIVADNCDADNSDAFAVLVVHFRYRDIEPALEPPDEAFNDAPLALERGHTQQR